MIKVTRDAMIPAVFMIDEKRQTVLKSEKLLLGQLFRRGVCTQADLTAALPLSQQSISRMATALEARGLISRRAPKLKNQRGQPSSMLGLNPHYAYTFGLSLMADGIALNLTDFAGNTVAYEQPKPSALTKTGVVSAVSQAMQSLTSKAGIHQQQIFGMGVATTGFRIGNGATFNTPPSLEEFALLDLEDFFSSELRLPVWAGNDGNAAALAENMTGVGRKMSNFAYVYFAAGIGGGLIIEGNLMQGARGNAGEFAGIVPLELFDKRPTLELLRKYVNAEGNEIKTVNELVTKFDDSWIGIDTWIEETRPALSIIVSAISAVLDTEAIVLGGFMPSVLAERLIPKIKFFDIKRRAVEREHATIIPAECRGDAAAIGASLTPFQDKYFTF